MEKIASWKVITHLVNCGMTNINGTHWGIMFSRYVDESRKMLKGGTIGFIDREGLIKVTDPSKHKVIFTKLKKQPSYLQPDEGCMVWLEKDN